MNDFTNFRISSRLRGLVTGVAFSLLLAGTSADANDRMGKLFDSYSVGSEYSGETSGGNVWTGGSFRGRWRQPSVDLVSFQPPSVSFGCGGFDSFAGAFGMVSGDQLVQVGRAVAQGAAVYLFNLSLNTICSSCATVMENVKKTLENFNQLTQNACQNTVTAMESYQAFGGTASENSSLGRAAVELTGNWAADSGNITSIADMFLDKAGFEGNASPNDQKRAIDGNVVYRFVKNTDPSHFGLLESFVSDFPGSNKKYRLASFLMSLMGTEIFSTLEDGESCGNEPVSNDSSRLCRTPKQSSLSIKNLLTGEGIDADDVVKFTEYRCSEEPTDPECVEVIHQDNEEIEPVLMFARRVMLGGGDISEGLFRKIELRKNLDPPQVRFITLMPIPYNKLKEVMDAINLDDESFAEYYALAWTHAIADTIGSALDSIYTQLGNQSFSGQQLDLRNDFKEKYEQLKIDLEKVKEDLNTDLTKVSDKITLQVKLLSVRDLMQGA